MAWGSIGLNCECHNLPSEHCPRNRKRDITRAERREATEQWLLTCRPDSILLPVACTCFIKPYPHMHTDEENFIYGTEFR
jgi:hypothetical protein